MEREEAFLTEQMRQTSLEGEPNRTNLNLQAVNEIPVLNNRELSILALMTKHDQALTRSLRGFLSGTNTGGASAYRDMLTGTGNPTPGMLSKDDQRTSVTNSAFWFSGMRRGDPNLTADWWDGLIRDAQGSTVDPRQFARLKDKYLKREQEILNIEGISEQERQNQLNAHREEYKVRIDAHVYGNSFAVEYGEALQAQDASGHGNALARLLDPEAQQSRLHSDLVALLREEGGKNPELFFDEHGNPNNDAKFESTKAINFIQQAMHSMDIAGVPEEDQYAFFGEFEPAVRLSIEHNRHVGTSVIKNQDGHLHIGLNSQHNEGVRYVQAMPGLSSTLDAVSDLIFTSPSQVEAYIVSAEATDMQNIVRPTFMAALNFLVDPSSETSTQDYSTSRSNVLAITKGDSKLSDQFSLGFTEGMRQELEKRGIDPDLYGSLLREDNPVNQFFRSEFRLQLNAKIGEAVTELEQIQGKPPDVANQEMQDEMLKIIKEAYSATIDATFGDYSPFVFIRGDGEQPIMVRNLGGYSPAGILQPNQSDEEFAHIRKTFDALETRHQDDVTRFEKQTGEEKPKYAPYVVSSDILDLSNQTRGENLTEVTTEEEAISVLADGMALFTPTSNASRVRANQILPDIGATLSQTPDLVSALKISGGFDVEKHRAELQEQREQEILELRINLSADGFMSEDDIDELIAGLPDDDFGVSSEVIRVVNNLTVMHLVYFNQRAAEGYGADEVLMIGSLLDKDSYRFRFQERNGRESLRLVVPTFNSNTSGSTEINRQILYDFYMPRHKGNGNYIPINSIIPKQGVPTDASIRHGRYG